MKMNKTRLLEKISIQSGISADECSTVLKTFERVLGEELTRKTHRYVQSPNQKIPDRKTKCVIKTHINIKQNVIFGAKLKPV
jgi:prevent-host-death family protein